MSKKTFASDTFQGGIEAPEAVCGGDILEEGLLWLSDQLKEHVAQHVVYIRGEEEIELCATFGKQLLKIDDGFGGVRMEWTDRDFLIDAADLVLDGQPALPQRGDQVREVRGESTYTFEVMAPGNEPPWRWCDPYRKRLRIHAKQIRVE